jgi:LysM repeat protein
MPADIEPIIDGEQNKTSLFEGILQMSRDIEPTIAGGQSKTSPQHAATLRKIMFLDRISKHRNELYEGKLAEFFNKTAKKDFTSLEKQGLKDSFTRNYYRPEHRAIAEYNAMKPALSALYKKKENEGLNGSEQKKMSSLEFFSAMPMDTFVAHKMFSKETIGHLRKQFSDVDKELSKEIKSVAELNFPGEDFSRSHRQATILHFDQKYPSLKHELSDLTRNGLPSMQEAGRAGMALLKYTSAVTNPSGFLISKAIGAILQSDTFKPLVSQAVIAIKRTAENTGLLSSIKKQLSKVPEGSAKRIAAGLAIGCAGGLLIMGLVEPDAALKVMADINESVENLYSQTHNTAYASDGLRLGDELTFIDDALSGPDAAGVQNDLLVPDAAGVQNDLLVPDAAGVQNDLLVPDGAGVQNDLLVPDAAGVQNDLLVPDGAGVQNDLLVPDAAGVQNDLLVPDAAAVQNDLLMQESPPEMLLQDALFNEMYYDPSVVELREINGLANEDISIADVKAANPAVVDGSVAISKVDGGVLEDYVIKPGDTLSEIVEAQLQKSGVPYNYEMISQHVDAIAKINGIENPDVIFANQSISLPQLRVADVMIDATEIDNNIGIMTEYNPSKMSQSVLDELNKINDPGYLDVLDGLMYVAPPPEVSVLEQSFTNNNSFKMTV